MPCHQRVRKLVSEQRHQEQRRRRTPNGPGGHDGQVRDRAGQDAPGEQPGDEHENDGDRPVRPDPDPGHPAKRYVLPHWRSPPASNFQAGAPRSACQEPIVPSRRSFALPGVHPCLRRAVRPERFHAVALPGPGWLMRRASLRPSRTGAIPGDFRGALPEARPGGRLWDNCEGAAQSTRTLPGRAARADHPRTECQQRKPGRHDLPGTQPDRIPDLGKAFFTSRGLGVAEVAGRGSAGYGRGYREQVYGRWAPPTWRTAPSWSGA